MVFQNVIESIALLQAIRYALKLCSKSYRLKKSRLYVCLSPIFVDLYRLSQTMSIGVARLSLASETCTNIETLYS